MKNIVILGSTGSIGINTLEVAAVFPDRLRVVGLGVRENIGLLRKQIERFHPQIVAVSDPGRAKELRALLGGAVEVAESSEGIVRLATVRDADIIVSAMVGAAGLLPTFEAVKAGKCIALANKEVLVCGGEVVMREASARGVEIVPIDSEHSALHQCLKAGSHGEVKRLILTASGGPFLRWSREKMKRATPEEALKHPRWQMGKKVTIDSATMMNKALEIIEARWLFGVGPEKIGVLVHPESVVHSMVEFEDGSVIAQMSPTDMRIPIQYALLQPERIRGPWESLLLDQIGTLHFEEPDADRFPALGLGRKALSVGGTLPAVMNAANEVAVERFLAGEISFDTITRLVGEVMEMHTSMERPSLREIARADEWARGVARRSQ